MSMQDRFTPGLHAAIDGAADEAHRLGNDSISPAHFLLVMLGDTKSPAYRALAGLNADPEAMKAYLRENLTTSPGQNVPATAKEMFWTPRAKHSLELSVEEARLEGSMHIDARHLFVGAILQGNLVSGDDFPGFGYKYLHERGIAPGDIRTYLRKQEKTE